MPLAGCSKSYLPGEHQERLWSEQDAAVQGTPMPAEYSNIQVGVIGGRLGFWGGRFSGFRSLRYCGIQAGRGCMGHPCRGTATFRWGAGGCTPPHRVSLCIVVIHSHNACVVVYAPGNKPIILKK